MGQEQEAIKEWVVAGLGNPGKKYEMTRHNIGFIVLQALAEEQRWNFKKEERFQAQIAKGTIGSASVNLVLPMTYMNESGQAVKKFLDYYKLPPSHLLVINDDVNLDYGAMRIRPRGSSGGHNGLNSIEACLGTIHYARLRLGIGKDPTIGSLADFVLDPFNEEEMKALPAFVSKAIEGIKLILARDVAGAMPSVNARVKQS